MSVLRSSYRCLFCLLVLFCLTVQAQPACADSSEYKVKTAMIYNMIRFMDWPDDALTTSASPFSICVMGKSGLILAVDDLQGKQIKGRTIAIHQKSPANGFTGCHMLILGDLDKTTTVGLLERTRSSAVVTVADSSGFARSGGTVGFILQNGKVRFEINQTAAQRHRIRISAQLLKLAQIIQETP